MLIGAKLTLKRLLYEDSGVAMAYTVLVSLFIFMLCISTYAMTENIRQKMELQNACDAAAYSGAVIQADMLSRIAILNRALSWTYAETNKRHMDSIVHDWLTRAVSRYDNMANAALTANRGSTCLSGWTTNGGRCGHCGGIGWFAGHNGSPAWIRLNGTQTVSVATIRATNASYVRNDQVIRNGYANMQVLNREIDYIRTNMNRYIGQAVRYSMQSAASRGASFGYFTDGAWGNTGAVSYILPQTGEARFLNYSGSSQAGDLQAGYGVSPNSVWWDLRCRNTGWWGADTDGFTRNYIQGAALRASGNAYATVHWHDTWGAHHSSPAGTWNFVVDGQDWITHQPARPARLSPNFFGSAGSIIVAAKMPMNSPFAALGLNVNGSVYDAFRGTGRDMWAVSSSRAGVRLNGDAVGHYRVLYPGATFAAAGYTSGTWNLCEEDWDAVMIPVNRAWHSAASGAWAGAPDERSVIDGTVDSQGGRIPGVREILDVATLYTGGMSGVVKH
ncbi:MAG: hypothetical protein J6S73_01590 [Lentisphaeria bacterium]|nr:hypothetical protein [Lentisphaeria bacterium]MBO5763541.1 hypothetical protein [Lentisphaeria bacterium]